MNRKTRLISFADRATVITLMQLQGFYNKHQAEQALSELINKELSRPLWQRLLDCFR